MTDSTLTPRPLPRPVSYGRKVGLVLQGGGALGSYQAGVYAGLAQSDYLPDWVCGISIGAINAALIAGNAPADRVARLRDFWEAITTPYGLGVLDRKLGANMALLRGQAGFFEPQKPMAWWTGQPTSYYDTSALRTTLERFVDFDRINARETAFSVAAVNVRTGNFAYFDNRHMRIGPEHVMASGALPPGFPAVEIDGEHYWDGGLVSNTPLEYMLEYVPRRSRLVFQVDVFPARGPLPTTLDGISERYKDIRYSSRTRAGTDKYRTLHDLRHTVNSLIEKLPPDLRATPEAEALYAFGCVTTMDVVELIHRPPAPEGQSKDYEFSRSTMETRWAAGLSDALKTLAASPWLEPMPPEVGLRTFDVLAPALPG